MASVPSSGVRCALSDNAQSPRTTFSASLILKNCASHCGIHKFQTTNAARSFAIGSLRTSPTHSSSLATQPSRRIHPASPTSFPPEKISIVSQRSRHTPLRTERRISIPMQAKGATIYFLACPERRLMRLHSGRFSSLIQHTVGMRYQGSGFISSSQSQLRG